MKTTLTIITVGCFVVLAGCMSSRTGGSKPNPHYIQFEHGRDYKTNGVMNRPDTVFDKWKFTDDHHNPTPILLHPIPEGSSLEWHGPSSFWLHVTKSADIDWQLCTSSTPWLSGANLPCPFNGPNDLGLAATNTSSDWVVALSFPTNALHRPGVPIAYHLIMSGLPGNSSGGAPVTREMLMSAAAAASTCNLVLEATLVWEPSSMKPDTESKTAPARPAAQ